MKQSEVNGELTGLFLTISTIARERGVDKAAVSRRVKRLEQQGLISTRRGPQGSKLVNLAEFDRVTGETLDLVRATNGVSRHWPFKQFDPVLAKEQARRASYEADLKELELLERQGKVIPIERVEEVTIRFAENFLRKIGQLPDFAEEMSSVVAKEGTAGARQLLISIAAELCTFVKTELSIASKFMLTVPP